MLSPIDAIGRTNTHHHVKTSDLGEPTTSAVNVTTIQPNR